MSQKEHEQQQPQHGHPIDGRARGQQKQKKVFEVLVQIPAILGCDDKEKLFLIGSSLGANERNKLAKFMRKNIDVFAWQHYNMPGILADMMCHKLHISLRYKQLKQKPRQSALEKAKVVKKMSKNYLRLVQLEKQNSHSGFQTQWLSVRRMASGRYVQILQI